ncbi:unnamed protein product [marine sediment metagenome]|uniref:Uncharacterized protein n=1 Tax=marine sediment metagenome TaxID=412755 RepID=X1DWH5_9ZZZZ
MKLWILVGALNGKINETEIFLQQAEALLAESKMMKNYSFPEITRNDVALFEKEI